MIDTTTVLGDIVTNNTAAARVLERHGLDFCCGGQRSLGDACAAAGLDTGTVVAELNALDSAPAPDWVSMPLAQLVDHLEAVHHRYLWEAMPHLAALAAKVEGVHGDRHPELLEVRRVYDELHAELEGHLMKEEQVLFPMVRELAGSSESPEFHCGSLNGPIRVMLMEHDDAGEHLARLRELTGGYQPPPDACTSYGLLYSGLAELEADTHLHIHKENNVLFPTVLAMENDVAAN